MMLCELLRDFPIAGRDRKKGDRVSIDRFTALTLGRAGVVRVLGNAAQASQAAPRASSCCF